MRGTSRSLRRRSLLVGTLVLALAGCVHVANEPILPFPERPQIRVVCREGQCCMSSEDAAAFLKWIEKVNEFEAARKRLEE